MTQSKRYFTLAWLALVGHANAHDWYRVRQTQFCNTIAAGAKTVTRSIQAKSG